MRSSVLGTGHYLRSTAIVFILLLIQATFVPYLSLEGYMPDLLLLWLVLWALQRGQIEATVAGFFVGLLQDMTATHFLGLAALAKTISGFVAGYFYNENKTAQTLGSYRLLLIVAFCSFFHNLIYFGIFFQGSELPLLATTLRFSLFASLYTALMSALVMFVHSRTSSFA